DAGGDLVGAPFSRQGPARARRRGRAAIDVLDGRGEDFVLRCLRDGRQPGRCRIERFLRFGVIELDVDPGRRHYALGDAEPDDVAEGVSRGCRVLAATTEAVDVGARVAVDDAHLGRIAAVRPGEEGVGNLVRVGDSQLVADVGRAGEIVV